MFSLSALLISWITEAMHRARARAAEAGMQARMTAELQQANESLRQSEARLQAVMQALPVGVAIIDAQEGNVASNPAFERIWGLPGPLAQSVSDYAAYQAWWLDSGEPVQPEEWASVRAVQHGEPVLSQEMEIQRFDGTRAIVWNSAAPIRDRDAHMVGSVVVIQDISEQKRLERELAWTARKFAAMFSATSDGVWLNNLQGEIVEVNDAYCRMSGYSRDELMHMPISRLEANESPEEIRKHIGKVLQGGHDRFESRHRRKDGTVFDVDITALRLKSADDLVAIFIRDITERNQAEEQIRQQNATLTVINQLFSRALSCETEEALGRTCLRLAEELTGSRFGFVAEINPQTGRLDDIAISDPGWDACRMAGGIGYRTAPTGFKIHGIYGRVVLDGKGLFTNDPSSHPDRVGTPQGHPPLTAFLGVPLLQNGQAVGMVAVGNRPGGYRAEHLAALEQLAPAITQVFLRRRAEQGLRAALAKAEAGERLLDALMENVPEGISIADAPDGALRMVSRAGREMTGAVPERVTGSLAAHAAQWRYYHADGITPARSEDLPLSRAVHEGAVIMGEEWVLRHPNGQQLSILCNAAPIRDATGAIVRGVSVWRDITERKRAEEALKEEARRKDEFLAMLAHELRNPLAPILNAVHLLRLIGPTEPRVEKARDLINRQVTHMVRLIDDLLDISRITRGTVLLRKDRVDLGAMVAQAVEAARPWITRKEQTLTISCAPEPIELDADPARLVQILSNLLNNAAKFTEPGGSITLTTDAIGEDVVIRVRDNGIGIPPELLPRIFDLFVQGETSLDRPEGGLGIGLTLVRHVVELHGGHIEAHSAGHGAGSEFIVTLPVAPPHATAPHITTAPHAAVVGPAQPGRRLRVLIVEDSFDAAESFVMLLQLHNHETRVAYAGPAAVELAAQFTADVAFIDLGLPGLDGFEVARRLRALPAYQPTVMIALSGYGQEEDKRRALEVGFDHHLTKPVDPGAIVRLLTDISGQLGRSPSLS